MCSVDNSHTDFSVMKQRATYTGAHCLVTTSDGKILFVRVWHPPSYELSNIGLLFLHGITAHSGAYNNILATPLAKGGFTVYGLDLRGHGLSDGKRGDIPSKTRLIRDICETIAFLKTQHQKILLLGHSVGVVSATHALSQCPSKISGAIFLSFARTFQTGVQRPLNFGTKIKIALSALFRPSRPIIKYSHPGIAGIGDPMYTFTYTLRFMRAINPRTMQIPPKISVPVYVGAGENDELFATEQVRRFYEEIPADRKEFHVLLGAKHAVFPPGTFDHLMNWIRTSIL